MLIQNLDQLCKETVKLKVLYVEDNKDTRIFTLKMLKHFFSEITVANDGYEGLEKFKGKHFDIIFTDILMPNKDGLEMIESIRTINTEVAIIIFSAYDDTPYFLKSIKSGIDGYFLKPFDYTQVEEVLYKTVNKILSKKKDQNTITIINGFYWDIVNELLCKNEKIIALTKSEFALFNLLSSKQKTIYSTIDIEMYIFDDDICDERRIRNLLSRLKKKLGCELIESIYAEGYRLKR